MIVFVAFSSLVMGAWTVMVVQVGSQGDCELLRTNLGVDVPCLVFIANIRIYTYGIFSI